MKLQCWSQIVRSPENNYYRSIQSVSNDLLTSPYLASRDGKASGTADALSISEEDLSSEKWKQKIGNLPVDAVFTYWGLACSLCNREVFLPEGGTFKLKLIMILGNKHCPTILAFVAPSSHLNLNSICLKFKYILCVIYTNTPFIVVSYRWRGLSRS